MVVTSRPRAHSASSVKLNQVLLQHHHDRNGSSVGGGTTGNSSSIISINSSHTAGLGGDRYSLIGGAPSAASLVAASASVADAARKKLSYSSPELRSMLVGLETTVPQNLNPSHLGSRHRPRKRRVRSMGSRASLSTLGRERGGGGGAGDFEGPEVVGCCVRCCCSCCVACCCDCCCCCSERGGRCCHTPIFLVLMQLLVGAGLTAVSVYMFLFLPVFIMRETPIWAGAPLCAAGILGIYFCAANFKDYSKTTRAYVLKILCSIFSVLSIILCATAAVFIAIHLGRILTYDSCQQSGDNCHCFLHQDDHFLPRIFAYPGLGQCSRVFCEVKIYLLVVGSLCLVGSLLSLWFIVLLWKARYGRFHSGVRLPSVRRRRYSVS